MRRPGQIAGGRAQPDEAREISKIDSHATRGFVAERIETGLAEKDLDPTIRHDEEPEREGDFGWNEEADADDGEVEPCGGDVGRKGVPGGVP